MFTTFKTAVARASERAARRRAFRFLDRQSDYMLKDIGVTRGDLYRSVMFGGERI
jgi:uncharacterized protein YjiS (DUF1127 family)